MCPFVHLLRSFALFCALLRTCVCALLRSFAPFCALLRSFALFCALLHSFALFWGLAFALVWGLASALFGTHLRVSASDRVANNRIWEFQTKPCASLSTVSREFSCLYHLHHGCLTKRHLNDPSARQEESLKDEHTTLGGMVPGCLHT